MAAGIKVSQLPAISVPALTDIFPEVQPPTGGITYRCTFQQLLNLFQPNISLTNAGNPNGNVAGTTYQFCWDTTNNVLYTCTTTGNSASAVWTAVVNITFPLAMNQGGTGANLTADNGAIVYSTGSALALLAHVTSAGRILQSGNAAAPTWSAATYPATTTINQLLYSSSANTVTGLSTANSSVLITSSGGVPSLSTVLPAGLTTTDPTAAQGIATKNYVDTIASGGGAPVVAATTANLNSTYNNGSSGVGATLTDASGTFAAFSIDGQSPSVGARVLIKNQSTNTQNGAYTLTQNGNGISIPWVLTRATDYNAPSNINNTGVIPVENGTVNTNTGWLNTTLMVTVGTTAITFVQFGVSFPVSVSNGGTGLTTTTAYGLITGGTTATGNFQNAGTGTSGQLYVSGGNAALGTWTNATGTGSIVKATSPTLTTPTIIGTNGFNVCTFNDAASTTDYFSFTSGANNSGIFGITSSQTNASFSIYGKGTGGVSIGASGGTTITPISLSNGSNKFNFNIATWTSNRNLNFPDADVTLVSGTMVASGGALGTPSSGVLTNCTGLPVSTGISGLGTGVATALAAGVTGSGNIALATSPTFTTPNIGVSTATSINFGGSTLSTYATGSWTPTDASGAGLTFSTAIGAYVQIGGVVIATCEVIYPATVSGSNAVIGGLPVTTSSSAGKQGGSVVYTTVSTLVRVATNQSATTIGLYTAAGAAVTNVTMSGATVYLQVIYLI